MSTSRTISKFLVAGMAIGSAAIAAYVRRVRPWLMHWGSRGAEVRLALPGDELVPHPKSSATHAVSIHAPASEVWAWLVQMGQGRGGFYSYDCIENWMGLDIHNADRILPEFQNLKVGEQVPLAPGGFGVPVAILEPCRTLVLHGDTRLDPTGIPTLRSGDFFNVSWGWFVEQVDDQTTRLIERWRADWNPSPQNTLFMRLFLEPGAFLMERKMLLGIKERAETPRLWDAV
ncbi:MAG: hypothetical protein ACM3S0_17740 [Acidobacteriota bacterium]